MAVVLRFLPILIVLVLFVAAVVDIVRIEPERVRSLPKPLWVIVAFVAFVGPILWFAVGREPRGTTRRRGPVAPDDDPEFLRSIAAEKEQEERIRDLEKRLSELDDDDPTKS